MAENREKQKNIACKNAIEEAIGENFDGLYLKQDGAKKVVAKFGAERVSLVLAYTVQKKDWDRRFTTDNRVWANQILRNEKWQDIFLIDSNPAVLNGFIDLARKEIQELTNGKEVEKLSISHYYVVNDAGGSTGERVSQNFNDLEQALAAYAVLPNHLNKQMGIVSTETPPSKIILIDCLNGWEDASYRIFASLDEKWMCEETMEAIMKVKSFIEDQDIEAAYRMGEKYFAIQTTSEGYDYTVYDQDFREIDGGVYERPGLFLKEAMREIVEDIDEDIESCRIIDYEDFHEKAEAVAQKELWKRREAVEAKIKITEKEKQGQKKISHKGEQAL